MKRNFVSLIIFLLALSTNGQIASVEKSIFNIQTGFLGVWLNNESKLSGKVALRSEIGFDSGIYWGTFYDKTLIFMTPVFTLEPRWYYNLQKRSSKSKSIKNNSGNFIGIKTSFNPDWFVISNYKDVEVGNQISIIPKWGIRRTFGSHFNFEAGFGIGYKYYFAQKPAYYDNENDLTAHH